MTTLDEYLAAQRARRAEYQKRYRARVMAKPDSARMMPFRDAMRQRMEGQLYGATPIDTTQEIRMLAAYFTAMARELPATDPVRRQALGTRSPEDASAVTR